MSVRRIPLGLPLLSIIMLTRRYKCLLSSSLRVCQHNRGVGSVYNYIKSHGWEEQRTKPSLPTTGKLGNNMLGTSDILYETQTLTLRN